MQTPATQCFPEAVQSTQAAPPAPQVASMFPALQIGPTIQPLQTHVLFTQTLPRAHTVPQVPQLIGSVWVFTQVDPHLV